MGWAPSLAICIAPVAEGFCAWHLQVIIGTHGRLKNWVSKRQLDVDSISILVFDEADEMLKADAFADDSGEAGYLGKGRGPMEFVASMTPMQSLQLLVDYEPLLGSPEHLVPAGIAVSEPRCEIESVIQQEGPQLLVLLTQQLNLQS